MLWSVVPLKTSVPLLGLNVPLFTRLPDMFKVVGAVNVPDMVRLLNDVVEVPPIDVVPPTMTVLADGVKTPLLVMFPLAIVRSCVARSNVPRATVSPPDTVVFLASVNVPADLSMVSPPLKVVRDVPPI